MTRPGVSVLLLIGLSISIVAGDNSHAQDNWPQFRGLGAAGVSDGNPPTTWDAESGTNIAWQTPIDGLGHSAPIIWGDRVFVTTAVNTVEKKPSLSTGWEGARGQPAEDKGEWAWQLLCLERSTGKVVWTKTAKTAVPTIKRHIKSSHANSTPATNGKLVVAFFGSEGLYCYDFDGVLKWDFSFGRLHSGPYDAKELEWGFASSPVIHDGHVIVQCDCLNTGFISVLNLHTGKEVRRIKRSDVATWSTPCVVERNGTTQVVCNGFREMGGYDLSSGKRLWTLSGGGDVPVPTPLYSNGMIYISNAHAGSHCYAISPDARGDITPQEDAEELPDGLAWHAPRGGSYMPTPIVTGGLHYTCNDRGILSVRDAATGEEIYRQRVSSGGSNNFTASGVATKDRLYFPAENGNVVVVRTGREYKLLATNKTGGVVMSTPAIAGDQFFIRTAEKLICIAATGKEGATDQ